VRPNDPKLDKQIVELIGRHFLTAELLSAGLEVAIPVRDRGVDMIAYADIDKRVENFSSCPIQLKASTRRSFSLDRKYERIHNLLIVYVWHLADDRPRVCYALTYAEALKIADRVGWTKTKSWQADGRYVTTNPSAVIVSLLEEYRMSSDNWHTKVLRVMDYPERERQKETGWELYSLGETAEIKARGLMMVVQAHFFRNPKAPNLAEYASHWLWASEGKYDGNVWDLLIAKYPLPDRPRIKRGYSDWDSFGDPTYRA